MRQHMRQANIHGSNGVWLVLINETHARLHKDQCMGLFVSQKKGVLYEILSRKHKKGT